MVIQYLLIAAFVAALAMTWRRVRQGILRRTTALAWSALWILAGVVVLRPETSSVLARFLGVGRGADAVIYGGLVIAFYLIFRLFTKTEALDRQITQIVREAALKGVSHDHVGHE